jgi:multidrug efflux pump subunit AcrB
VKNLQVRNATGDMIPLGSLLDIREAMGPDHVIRYNLYPSAACRACRRRASAAATPMEIMSSMLEQKRPQGIGSDWTALSFQEQRAGGQAGLVFLLAPRHRLPDPGRALRELDAAAAGDPVGAAAVLGAMLGLLWRGMDNNIYTQVGSCCWSGSAPRTRS